MDKTLKATKQFIRAERLTSVSPKALLVIALAVLCGQFCDGLTFLLNCAGILLVVFVMAWIVRYDDNSRPTDAGTDSTNQERQGHEEPHGVDAQ